MPRTPTSKDLVDGDYWIIEKMADCAMEANRMVGRYSRRQHAFRVSNTPTPIGRELVRLIRRVDLEDRDY